MVYKKYIKRDGKIFGPYYYESYRENGKVKTRFIRGPSKKDTIYNKIGNNKHMIIFFSVFLLIVLTLLGFIYFSGGGGGFTGFAVKSKDFAVLNKNFVIGLAFSLLVVIIGFIFGAVKK